MSERSKQESNHQRLQQVNIGDELECMLTAAWQTLLAISEQKRNGVGQLHLMDEVMVFG